MNNKDYNNDKTFHKFSTCFFLLIVVYILLHSFLVVSKALPYFVDPPDEITIVAQVIASEACGDVQEMWAVSNVVNNRMHSNSFPNTAYLVVTQPNQFAVNHKNKHKLFLECGEIALFLAENLDKLPDITNGALYFRNFGRGHIYYKRGEVSGL